MTTKAHMFAIFEERKGQRRPRRPKKKPRSVSRQDPVDTSRAGVSATDRKVGAAHSAGRNRSARALRKASYRLEDSTPPAGGAQRAARPSRKSTRRSRNRVKPDSNLARRQTRRLTAPERKVR